MNIFDTISAALAKARAIAAVVLGLFPVIINSIIAAEQALGPGTGSAKLGLVLNLVEAVFAQAKGIDIVFEDVAPIITNLVSALIAAWKATGQAVGGAALSPPSTPPAH